MIFARVETAKLLKSSGHHCWFSPAAAVEGRASVKTVQNVLILEIKKRLIF